MSLGTGVIQGWWREMKITSVQLHHFCDLSPKLIIINNYYYIEGEKVPATNIESN